MKGEYNVGEPNLRDDRRGSLFQLNINFRQECQKGWLAPNVITHKYFTKETKDENSASWLLVEFARQVKSKRHLGE